jgi:hypothetical protein
LSAFKQLLKAYTKAVVQIHFIAFKLIRLETGSSGFAIARIISQQSELSQNPSDEPSKT